MERELYRALYQVVWTVGQSFRSPRMVHPDWRIVMVYLWAVLHDRPVSWACRRSSWPSARRDRLPSCSTMSRRLRRAGTHHFLNTVEQRLRHLLGGVEQANSVVYIDGKALPVGGLSGDPDATVGYGAGKLVRGYKLHVLCDQQGLPVNWSVRTVKQAEPSVAVELLSRLHPAEGYVVADGNYDKNPVYEQAGQRGRQLIARQRKGKALGHRRHSRYRLLARQMDPAVKGRLYSGRWVIERTFGTLCSGSAGLAPLPSWVRRLHRVRLWVQAKIIIYYMRLRIRRNAS